MVIRGCNVSIITNVPVRGRPSQDDDVLFLTTKSDKWIGGIRGPTWCPCGLHRVHNFLLEFRDGLSARSDEVCDVDRRSSCFKRDEDDGDFGSLEMDV